MFFLQSSKTWQQTNVTLKTTQQNYGLLRFILLFWEHKNNSLIPNLSRRKLDAITSAKVFRHRESAQKSKYSTGTSNLTSFKSTKSTHNATVTVTIEKKKLQPQRAVNLVFQSRN